MRLPRYIYEHDDWPDFKWDDVVLSPQLADLRHHQGRLLGRMELLGFSQRMEATLTSLTDEVVKTSEIEGEILDVDQVRASLARRLGIDIGALAPASRDVEGVVEMTLDATRNCDTALSEERLFGWHAALFPSGYSGLSRIRTGQWRDDRLGPMQVVSGPVGRERVHYEAPSAVYVPRMMAEFLEWFNSNDSPDLVVKSAVAHLWFVTIHPFDDGNGRIARAIADLLLARSDHTQDRYYSMSAQIRIERKTYYDQLEAAQHGLLEITGWLQWYLACLGRSLGRAEDTLSAVMAKARFWEEHREASLNSRQRVVINRLLDGVEGKLTTSKWAKLTKCSQDTALRDISGLLEIGILVKDPASGRSTSYSLAGSYPS